MRTRTSSAAGEGIERFYRFLIAQAVEKNEFVVRDDWTTKPVARGFLPDDGRTFGAPAFA